MISDKQHKELDELDELLDDDLISDDEYELTKDKIKKNEN